MRKMKTHLVSVKCYADTKSLNCLMLIEFEEIFLQLNKYEVNLKT